MTDQAVDSAAVAAARGGGKPRVFKVHWSTLGALQDGLMRLFKPDEVDLRIDSNKHLTFHVKESALHSWIEARNALTENQGGNEMAFLCAVDGLRKDPSTGEKRTTDWRHYADNLKVELLPVEHDFCNDDDEPRDSLVSHVHAVRRMYRLLRSPEEVQSALARYYGNDDDCWCYLPMCVDKFVTRVMPALERYYGVMNVDDGGLDRMTEVANHLGLPLDSKLMCNDEKSCIACRGGGSPTWGGQVWPKEDDDDTLGC